LAEIERIEQSKPDALQRLITCADDLMKAGLDGVSIHMHACPDQDNNWADLCKSFGQCELVEQLFEVFYDTPDNKLQRRGYWYSLRNGTERLKNSAPLTLSTQPSQSHDHFLMLKKVSSGDIPVVLRELLSEEEQESMVIKSSLRFIRFHFGKDRVIDALEFPGDKWYSVARLKIPGGLERKVPIVVADSRLFEAIAFKNGFPHEELYSQGLPQALHDLTISAKPKLSSSPDLHSSDSAQRFDTMYKQLKEMTPMLRDKKPDHWVVYTGAEDIATLIDTAVASKAVAEERLASKSGMAILWSTTAPPPNESISH
jgi:hypothetical protein